MEAGRRGAVGLTGLTLGASTDRRLDPQPGEQALQRADHFQPGDGALLGMGNIGPRLEAHPPNQVDQQVQRQRVDHTLIHQRLEHLPQEPQDWLGLSELIPVQDCRTIHKENAPHARVCSLVNKGVAHREHDLLPRRTPGGPDALGDGVGQSDALLLIDHGEEPRLAVKLREQHASGHSDTEDNIFNPGRCIPLLGK